MQKQGPRQKKKTGARQPSGEKRKLTAADDLAAPVDQCWRDSERGDVLPLASMPPDQAPVLTIEGRAKILLECIPE